MSESATAVEASSSLSAPQRTWTDAEIRVLDAVTTCCERWGLDKVTIDDIARESGLSRATLYRMFPGGRDVILEASRVYELDQFFATVLAGIEGIDNLHDLLARTVAISMQSLREDEHLGRMMASEPGHVISEMTVDGLPRIIRVTNAYMIGFVDPYLPSDQARALIDVTVRLVISYFLAPSDLIDLADERQAHAFIGPFLPASHRRPSTPPPSSPSTTPSTPPPSSSPSTTPSMTPPTPASTTSGD